MCTENIHPVYSSSRVRHPCSISRWSSPGTGRGARACRWAESGCRWTLLSPRPWPSCEEHRHGRDAFPPWVWQRVRHQSGIHSDCEYFGSCVINVHWDVFPPWVLQLKRLRVLCRLHTMDLQLPQKLTKSRQLHTLQENGDVTRAKLYAQMWESVRYLAPSTNR